MTLHYLTNQEITHSQAIYYAGKEIKFDLLQVLTISWKISLGMVTIDWTFSTRQFRIASLCTESLFYSIASTPNNLVDCIIE